MDFIQKSDRLIICSKEDFNPQHILECGQIFAYEKIGKDYVVFSRDKSARIVERVDGYKILTKDADYFKNFFDLETDYGMIKKQLSKFDLLKKPIEFGSGIRILKNDLFEVLISLIISANNNIKRIQKIISSLKRRLTNGSDFPSQKQLLTLSVEDFYDLGLGYRAPQLFKALRQFDEKDLENWKLLPTEELRKRLISISGIGPKVADCVLLFGFSKKDVFPVDTWINKMYNRFYPPLTNRNKIRENLIQTFGDLSGYAQQYLFYFSRSSF